MKFRKKPVVIEAMRWFRNGDHPEDDCDMFDYPDDEGNVFQRPGEGKVVRYYRAPYDDGQRKCEHCGRLMHDHGWIDTLEGGHVVCPGDWIIKGVKGRPMNLWRIPMKISAIPWKRSNSVEDIKHRAWGRGAASTFITIFAVGTVADVASGEWMRAFIGLSLVLASVLWLWACQDRKPGEIVWYVSSEVDGDCTADNMEDVMSKEDAEKGEPDAPV